MGGKKAFELMLEIGYKSQPLKAKLPNGYTHKWTIFVRGANNSKIEHCVQRIVFQLHDSFPNPHREITEPPYQVKEKGYAGFEIPIEIYFKNREKPNHVVFNLDLCLLLDRPHCSTMSEKVKFYHPNREFEKCLIKTGAKMLAPTKDKKERSDSPPAKKQKSSSLIPSKDMSKQAPQAQSQVTNHSQSSLTHHHSSSQHQSKSQQNHHHSHQNLSSSNNHSTSTNHTSSNNHHKHSNNNHHQNNHQSKQSSHQQSSLPKSKPSNEFIDVFGAPIVYNNNSKSHKSGGRETDNRDATFTSKDHPTPTIPKISNNSPQVITQPVSQTQRTHFKHQQVKSSNSHHHSKSAQSHLQTKPVGPRPKVVSIDQATHQHQPAQPQPQTFASQSDPLQMIQAKISSLSDNDRLQKIVDIIEESGEWFNLTPNKFEFDLKRLDRKTVHRIEKCLNL